MNLHTYSENYIQKFILGKIELDQDHTHILMSNFLVNKNSIPNLVTGFACRIFDPPARFINVEYKIIFTHFVTSMDQLIFLQYIPIVTKVILYVQKSLIPEMI